MTATACTDTLDEAALPKPLSVDVNARDITARAPIHGTALPDASSIGISLLAEDGTAYDGVTYANLKYTASGTAPDQTWSTPNIPTLSSTSAKLVAYYPWADGMDYTAVPVETDTQTDYMYSGWMSGLSNANPNASIVMQHALTAVRVALVKGDFTADVDVSSVSVKSPAFATAGSLDATTGALSGLSGTGEAVTVTADFPLTAQATNVEVMAVPDVSVAAGVTTVTTQIGDRKYSVNINFTESYKQGYIYTYTLTLNNTGMEVTSVAVTPWQEGTVGSGELGVELDNKYIVEIEVEEDNTLYAHNMFAFTGTIDWGDGTTSTYDEFIGWPSHTYSTAGKYTVTATGMCMALMQAQYEDGTFTDTDLILSRLAWGDYINYSPAFITQLIHIGKDMHLTDMINSFAYQTKLTEIPEGIFDGLIEVTTFDGTFAHCTNIMNIPEGLFDKCTEVNEFTFTFSSCTGLTNIPQGLFENCTEVTGFNGTFATCTGLKSIPEGLFDKCTEVASFGDVFRQCFALETIPGNLFQYNTKVMSFSGIFNECSKLKSIPAGLFDNCVKVESFGGAFAGCSGITSIPVGLFDKCTEATGFTNTFFNCTGLTSIPTGLFDNNRKIEYVYSTFENCTSLTGESPYTTIKVDGNDVKVHLYERKNYPGIFASLVQYGNCFASCTGLTDYATMNSVWK